MLGPRTFPIRSPLGVVTLVALGVVAACGAGDDDKPPLPTIGPPKCERVEEILQPLYALEDAHALDHVATAIRTTLPEDVRRDFVDAVLRLVGAFPSGSFAALDTLPDGDAGTSGGPGTTGDPGAQGTLAKVLRWLVETGPSAPNTPVYGLLRRALNTCEGAPVFELLSEMLADDDLLQGLADLLGNEDLANALLGLDFEGANGRQATQLLVRNLLVSASGDAFDLNGIINLLGLLVDLENPPYDRLVAGLERVLDADGLVRLQGLLACLHRVDPDLVSGGLVYDLLTSGLLSDLAGLTPAEGEPLLPTVLKNLLTAALDGLAKDAEVRRGLVPALTIILRDDLAPGVLGDVAAMLDAQAINGVLEVVVDLATGKCRR